MDRDYEYEKNNTVYDDIKYQGESGIKCKNYELCNSLLPFWWFDCKECYLCTNCDIMFGTWCSGNYKHEGKGVLEMKDDIECPICLEIKRSISFPKCEHFVCIDCFKTCFCFDDEEQPPFPYPDIEDEYDDDPDNPKWNNYPLIKIFNDEINRLEDIREEKYENSENLRRCPLCRK